jgi:hypothetical protein
MGRILLAFRVFFRVLFDVGAAEQVRTLLETATPAEDSATERAPKRRALEESANPKPKSEPKPTRSDAITFLATLQREARFVDFVQEPIDGYGDAQIGAAVREVHRECSKVLERLFDLQPVVTQREGAEIEVPGEFDAERYRLTGKVVDEPPFNGRLVHHGWEASKCELPTWTGKPAAARLVAAAEVEIP